ncbi:scaffold protein [Salmonella phage SE4]|uniref:head scaffolding protein n=1 Tax=Salmonella phage SE4 TaxID=2575328 RepID=UPI0011D2D71C|nr:head scaffolding protein [Salmonella phage SE4]QEG07784.1 scaffold protein [Salmonella phage SE4]
MALKTVVTDLNEIDEGFRGLYVKDDASGAYRLDVEPDEKTTKELEELRKEKQRMEQHTKKLLEEKKKEAERARLAEEERARRDRDVESLERSLREKHQADIENANSRTALLQAQLEGQMVDNLAMRLANELSDTPALIMPHIKSRLRAQEIDGRWKTTVVDVMGNPTATTPDELVEHMRADKQFAPLVRGTKAGGGGANGGGANPGGNGGGEQQHSFGGGDDRVARARAKIQNTQWGQK